MKSMEHGADEPSFHVGNFRLERHPAEIRIHTHHVRAKFDHDGLGVVSLLAPKL